MRRLYRPTVKLGKVNLDRVVVLMPDARSILLRRGQQRIAEVGRDACFGPQYLPQGVAENTVVAGSKNTTDPSSPPASATGSSGVTQR